MKRILSVLTSFSRADQGVALPLALMALLVLAAMSGALLTIGSSEVQIAYNHYRGTLAQFLAEAGMEDFFNAARSNTSVLYSAPNDLTNVDACTGATPPVPCRNGPGTALEAFGTYIVQYQKAGTDTVLVVATGTSRNATKVLRALISNGYISNEAIRTKGDLTNSGRITASGTCGSGHTNEDVDNNGTAFSFSQGLSASGTIDPPGSATSAPQKLIPTINVADYWAKAKATNPTSSFHYRTDGSVVRGDGSTEFTYAAAIAGPPPVAAVDTYRGWVYTPGTGWILPTTGVGDVSNATYYFEQNITFPAFPGITTVTATFLSTGNITVGSNARLSYHLPSTVLAANGNIELSGGPTLTGVLAAHGSVNFAGTASITGSVLAEGTVGSATAGNISITYDCNGGGSIPGPVRYLAWGF